MLDKLGGVWVNLISINFIIKGPKTRSRSPQVEREHSLDHPHPVRNDFMSSSLRNRLKYALNGKEVKMILNDKEANVLVDGRIRRDEKFPAGFQGMALYSIYDRRCHQYQENW